MNVIDLHSFAWNQLQGRRVQLPHALLLTGQKGLGKFALAQAFAAGLLCEQPRADGRACGQCLACGWHAQGNHPDFRLLQPEAMAEVETEGEDAKKKASQQITIDQVRGLDDFMSVGTHRAGLRVIVVYPAEAMNRNTANSLLKSLEEPSPGTLFILVSNEPLRLLLTIRSRCQVLPVPTPVLRDAVAVLRAEGVAEPEHWLSLAGGAPIMAAELAASGQGDWLEQLVKRLVTGGKDALGSAADLDKLLRESKGRIPLKQVVEWAQKWVFDLTLACEGLPARYFLRHQATITQLAGQATVTGLLGFHRRLLEARRQAEQPLNSRLFLEQLFFDYRALFAS